MPLSNHRTVLILFNLPQGSDPFALISEGYRQAYEVLYDLAEKNGIRLLRAPIEWYDEQRNVFTQAIGFEEGDWHILREEILVDAIYDKADTGKAGEIHHKKLLLSERYPFINDPAFTKIVRNKHAVGELLPQHFKPYYRVSTTQELSRVLDTLPGDYFVVKPEQGSGGNGVIIDTREHLLHTTLVYPLIVQEFIDSSHGIPHITPGYHDLRLVFINEELIYSYIRTPEPGSFIANVARGGSMHIIEPKNLPLSLQPIIRDVQEVFSRFTLKVYTIDLIFDKEGRPWIIELNSMPGIYFSPGQEATRDRFYYALVQIFRKISE